MKLIKGSKALLEELQANLFNRISEEGHEINGNDTDGYALKIDVELFSDDQLRVIESALYARMRAGILDTTAYAINESIVQNCFSLTADSNEKLEIIKNDILRGAKIKENQVVVLTQPWAPEMYNTQIYVVIVIGLNQDQMKAIELSTKMTKGGMKITTFAKKAGMVGTSSAHVVNRVGKEVGCAVTEIGATIGVGAVRTGVECVSVAANIAIRDLNPKELAKGENFQTLVGTVKSLWGRNKETNVVGNGFASL